MIRSVTAKSVSAACVGMALGCIFSVRWTIALCQYAVCSNSSVLFLERYYVVAAILLAIIAIIAGKLFVRAHVHTSEQLIATAVGATVVGSLFHIAQTASVSGSSRLPGFWFFLIATVLAAAVISWRKRCVHLIPLTLLALTVFIPGLSRLGAVWGDQWVRSAAQYIALPSPQYAMLAIASWALFGALVGGVVSVLMGIEWLGNALRWCVAGGAFAAIAVLIQTSAALVAMQEGLRMTTAVLVHVLLWPIVFGTTSWAMSVSSSRGKKLAWVVPVMVVLVPLGYCFLAHRGASAYFSLKKLHSDTDYVYIHFENSRAWQRTFQSSGSYSKLRRCYAFLQNYPFCAYRPAALVQLAETQFELWHFRAALETIHRIYSEYPSLRGYPAVLKAIAVYMTGRPDALFDKAAGNDSLRSWAETQGALITAAAAERAGRLHRALGAYNSYIEFLASQRATAWRNRSMAYARSCADRLASLLDSGHSFVPRSTVVGKILQCHQPLLGARIVLVRPHWDAALFPYSKRFTDAWSVPAWSGVYAVSDKYGRFKIRDVPYGSYEVVVGLPTKLVRRGLVIAPAVQPITVQKPITRVQPIQLVPAVKQLGPESGAEVSAEPTLTWKPYPRAAYYSVSIIACEPRTRISASGLGTCWARTRITDTFTRVTPHHFVNGHTSLKKGGTYMWIVYAYDSSGKLVSSSEHYGQLQETSFRVARTGTK